MDKNFKLSACLGFALAGWLIPASMPLPKPLQGLSLGFALTATIAGASESKRENVRRKFSGIERDQEFEILATEQILSHEKRLNELYRAFGYEDDEVYHHHHQDDRIPQDDRPLTQENALATNGEMWDLQSLLDSNSSHVLLIGQTGSGKTTLARYLIEQIGGSPVILDADDDGQTWRPYTVVGAGDDWLSIEGALQLGLEEFSRRKPNDSGLKQCVYVLEELPDLISECGTGTEFCSRILRRGRKRKMFCIGLTQDPNTGTIGLSQPVQKCFTRVYLGGMGRHALKNLVPRGQRESIAQALSGCTRPAVIEFLGEWYGWDVPDLSALPTTTNTIAGTGPSNTNGNGPSNAPTIAGTGPSNTNGNGPTIALLNKCLDAALPECTALHWAIIDYARELNKPVSVRDVMRKFPKIPTADDARRLLQDLIALELGELQDGKFTAY